MDLELEPKSFSSAFREKLDNNVLDEELDAIDDFLIGYIGAGDEDAVKCARISVDMLSEYDRPWPLAYALNTLIIALVSSGDIAGARDVLKRLIDHSIEFNTAQAGLSGIDNVEGLLSSDIPFDHIPYFISEFVKLYMHFSLADKAIATLIKLADISSNYGAFQTAYRALADAERLSHEHQLGECLARVLTSCCAVSLLESDHAYSIDIGKKAVNIYEQLDLEVPDSLILNIATAEMQSNNHEEAISTYDSILSRGVDSLLVKLSILINLSACCRQVENITRAMDLMCEARDLLSNLDGEHIPNDVLTELELISAANFLAKNQFSDAVENINSAVKLLDYELLLVDRIHYRRGLRERYISRVEALLCKLPVEGNVSDIVSIISFTRQNQASDWIHALGWADEIGQKISLEDKERLDNLLSRMANFGVPFLYGFREKYNDPLEYDLMPDPWPTFTGLSDEFCSRYGFCHPFSSATLDSSRELICQRLDQGYGVLVGLLTGGGKAVFLISSRYYLCDLPVDKIESFNLEVSKHRQGGRLNDRLNSAICNYQAALLDSFKVALNELSTEKYCGLIFMPDRVDLLPINLVSVGYEPLRLKMAKGKFEVRTCVALYPVDSLSPPKGNLLGLIEQSDDLRFANAEIRSFFNHIDPEGLILVNPRKEEFYEKMASAESLVVAQHGIPIGLFNDPHFANLSGVESRSVLSFDVIQENAFKWQHRLVVLSSCHSGVNINRNFQGEFKSHELVGYPSILLTNRKSAVVAASWAIVDRFGYFLTTLFAKEMSEKNVSLAFNTALAKIVELPSSDILKLYDYIEPGEFQNSVVEKTAIQPIVNLTRQPACYGAYQIYTLF